MIRYSLPNRINPLPDETLSSFLERLSKENAAGNAEHMISMFSEEKELDLGVGIEPRGGLYELADLLDIDISDVLSLYMKTSLMPFAGMFLPPGVCDRYINYAFRKMRPDSVFKKDIPKDLFGEAKVCPQCARQELDTFGFWYLHRAHQIPGVSVCAEHGTLLMTAGGHPDFKEMPEGEMCAAEDRLREMAYAEAVCELLEDVPDVNADDIKCWLRERVPKGHPLYRPAHVRKRKLDVRQTLMYLIETEGAGSIRDIFREIQGCAEDRMDIPDGIQVFSEKRDLPVIAKCKTCGNEFITTRHILSIGWGCPRCAQNCSDTEIITNLVNTIGNGKYELRSEIRGFGTMTLLHRTCGKEFEVECSGFISNGKRCPCERQVSFDEMARRIEKTGALKILEYTGTANKMLVRALPCGHEFRAKDETIIRSGCKCLVCAQQPNMAKRRFEEFLESLDDTYTVEEWIDTKHVKMRHEACGRTRIYNTVSFRRGARCRCGWKGSEGQREFLRYIRDVYGTEQPFTSSDERLLQFASYSSIHLRLSRLHAAGLIGKVKKGTYILTKEQCGKL